MSAQSAQIVVSYEMMLAIACPRCGAAIGESCRKIGDATKQASLTHTNRWRAAAGLPQRRDHRFDAPGYVKVCLEDDSELNPDGTCPQCRDKNGQPFILDMQSYYLREKTKDKSAS